MADKKAGKIAKVAANKWVFPVKYPVTFDKAVIKVATDDK